MCRRYACDFPTQAVARRSRTVNAVSTHAASQIGALRQDMLVAHRQPENGERHPDVLTWGLVLSWTKEIAACAGRSTGTPSRRARRLLAGRDQLAPECSGLCIVPAEADVNEMGLAKNVVRLPIHSVGWFEMFRKLIDKGFMRAFARAAAAHCIEERLIMHRTRVRRVAALRRYMRDDQLFACGASGYVRL